MSVSCTFLDLDTDFVLNLPEVTTAKEQIDKQTQGSIYFTIQLTPSIRRVLTENLNLNCSSIETVPMRWIKGDTHPHIDKGTHSFDTTYLAYLTDSPGNLMIDGKSYPIAKRSAYIFSEGLSHETIETGSVPRLLLGPMSENGISVGASTTITADGETDTIYINYTAGDGITYRINDGSSPYVSFPVTIENSNTAFPLKVLFETDITLSTSSSYFICDSDNIQFGSTSLKNDGTRPIITIDGVPDYPGLIQNGTSVSNGFNDINVYNIKVDAINVSTLAEDGGWIGQTYFGSGASNNYIVNCSSTGDISASGGGILGSFVGYESAGNLIRLIGCSSSGAIGQNGGGIVGAESANAFIAGVSCLSCWSTGDISENAGGIYGRFAGEYVGKVFATSCYSEGNIGIRGGGIFGYGTGQADGTAYATNCYSRSLTIDQSGGGIFGQSADGTTRAKNCYSIGTWTGGTRGIYGADPVGTFDISFCYPANGAWTNSAANAALTGEPIPPAIIANNWVYTAPDTPYEINLFGYSPYSITNINISSTTLVPSLITLHEVSINVGESTPAAIVSNKSYEKLQIFLGDPSSYGTITINPDTGVVSTTSATKDGFYAIYLRNEGSYNITGLALTVNANAVPNAPICFPAGTLVLTDQGEVAIDKIDIKKNTIGGKEIIAITESIPLDNYLICIEKGSLSYNVPNRRTIISKDHKIMCNKNLIRAECLIEYTPSAYKVNYDKKKLYNVLLREHSTMSVNNLTVETLNPKSSVAKIYTGNYTPKQRNGLIKAFNKYNQETRKKTVLSRNIFIR
jgi:hypothetical protein